MAISTYSQLKAKIRQSGHRTDQPDSLIDDYIDQTESDIWQRLRIRSMDTRAEATTNSTRYLALPDDFIKMRNLTSVSGGKTIEFSYVAPNSLVINSASGLPVYYTVTSQLEFDRIPSTLTLTMQYFKQLTPLSDANTTNDILTRFPNIYLFGCMQYLKLEIEELEEASFWEGKFEREISQVNKQDKKDGYGPTPAVHFAGTTP